MIDSLPRGRWFGTPEAAASLGVSGRKAHTALLRLLEREQVEYRIVGGPHSTTYAELRADGWAEPVRFPFYVWRVPG